MLPRLCQEAEGPLYSEILIHCPFPPCNIPVRGAATVTWSAITITLLQRDVVAFMGSWVHGFMITGELTVAKIKRRGRDGESPLDSQNGKHTYMRSNRPASGLLPFQRLDHRLLHAQRFNMLRLSRNIHT